MAQCPPLNTPLVCPDRKLKNQLLALCWWFDSASTKFGFQRTWNRFAAAYDSAGIKISSVKTDLLHVSRNPNQCLLQLNGATQKPVYKFKYLGVAFTSDGRQDEELDIRIGKAIAIKRALYYSVAVRRELSKKQSSQFSKQSLSLPSYCISVWSRKFGNDWKNAIASASVQNEVSPKNQRSYIIHKMCISWDLKISRAATSPNWKISA